MLDSDSDDAGEAGATVAAVKAAPAAGQPLLQPAHSASSAAVAPEARRSGSPPSQPTTHRSQPEARCSPSLPLQTSSSTAISRRCRRCRRKAQSHLLLWGATQEVPMVIGRPVSIRRQRMGDSRCLPRTASAAEAMATSSALTSPVRLAEPLLQQSPPERWIRGHPQPPSCLHLRRQMPEMALVRRIGL